MRVSTNMFNIGFLNQIERLSSRQINLQNQVSTGQRISAPEDDPATAKDVMDIKSELRAIQQYRKNISALQDRISIAFESVRGIKRVSDRANEIAVLADSLSSPEELRAYAEEVSQLIEQTINLASSKYNGMYIFNGDSASMPPYEVTRDSDGKIISVQYKGNTSAPEYEIDTNLKISGEIPAENTTGTGAIGLLSDTRTGADFINHLIALRDNLLSGNTGAIKDTLSRQLQNDEDHIITLIARLGATKSTLQVTDNLHAQRIQALQNSISNLASTDLAQTIVRLNETQNAYLATLQTGSAIFNQSLLDFLR